MSFDVFVCPKAIRRTKEPKVARLKIPTSFIEGEPECDWVLALATSATDRTVDLLIKAIV